MGFVGIESDQVVYEYLSRVGDIAQQRQLPSATRMRLVSELRNEIDRRRAKAPVDSPAAVRRIVDRLGSPDDVVAAAADAGTGAGVPATPTPSVPVQRDDEQPPAPRPKGLRRVVPRPRPSTPPPAVGREQPEWWRGEPERARPAPNPPGTEPFGGSGAFGVFGAEADVAGFTGRIEIPEMLGHSRPKPPEDDPEDLPEKPDLSKKPKEVKGEKGEKGEPEGKETAGGTATTTAPRRTLPSLRPVGGWSNPLLLLAAVALVAGAVLGNPLALAAGWGIAYVSRRLTATETRIAVFWLPGAAVAAGLVWLWGRSEGRWGGAIAEGRMGDAVSGTWPWTLKGAAVASALFLVWRSQRQK